MFDPTCLHTCFRTGTVKCCCPDTLVELAKTYGTCAPMILRAACSFVQVTLEDYAGSIDTSVRNYAAVAQCETEEEFNDSYEDAFTFSSINSARQTVRPSTERLATCLLPSVLYTGRCKATQQRLCCLQVTPLFYRYRSSRVASQSS